MDASRAMILPLAAMVMITPGLALFFGLSVTPMLAMAGLWAIAVGVAERHRPAMFRRHMIVLAVLFCWAAVSCLWTPTDLRHALGTTLSATCLTMLGLSITGTMDRMTPDRLVLISKALICGMGITVFLAVCEVALGHPLAQALFAQAGLRTDLQPNRGSALLALLLWPTTALLSPWAGMALFATAAAAIVAEGKTSLILGLGAGSLVFALTRTWPMAMVRMVRVILTLCLLTGPLWAGLLPPIENGTPDRSTSALHRLIIWSFVRDRIAEHPIWGWGMDASRTMPGGDDEQIILLASGDGTLREQNFSQLPLHPHNAILQIWLELGLPGVVLSTVFIWTLCKMIGRMPRPALPLAALTTGFVIANLSFGLWQSWWLASLWLTAAMFALGPRGPAHVST